MDEQNGGAVSVEIPDLKERDRERKKAGFFWAGGSKGAPFSGAPAGSGHIAASAALRHTSETVLGQAAFQAGRSALAALAAKVAVALAALVAVAAGGALVMRHEAIAPKRSLPWLGGISSSIKVSRESRSMALDYAADAAKGELLSESEPVKTQSQAARQPEPQPAQPPAAQPLERTGMLGEAGRDTLPHNLSGAKLSTGLGSSFGNKSIFAAGHSPKFGDGAGLGRIGSLGRNLKAGKAGKMSRRQARAGRALNLGRLGTGSSRALGQLRGMATLNSPIRAGGPLATETNRALATTQFEGSETRGAISPLGEVAPAVPPGNTPTGGAGTGPLDAGQVCTPAQLSAGWVSNGAACVPGQGVGMPSGAVNPLLAILAAKALGMVLSGLVLLFIADLMMRVALKFKKKKLTKHLYKMIWKAAAGLAALAAVFALMAIKYGEQIKTLGGLGPNANVSLAAGGVLLAEALAIMKGGQGHGLRVIDSIMRVFDYVKTHMAKS